MLSAGWILEAWTAIALVIGLVADTFGQRPICPIMRSPKSPKPGNQVQSEKQESPFYFLVNLSYKTCGSSLVSSASTLRLWQTQLGLGQRTAVGIPINEIAYRCIDVVAGTINF